MKAERTVRKELKALRDLIDSPDADSLTKRVAWEVEQAIRWAREDVKQWPRPVESAVSGANLIREEVKRGDIKL
jgi:hypothetical protein